jgi:hypothetical protein
MNYFFMNVLYSTGTWKKFLFKYSYLLGLPTEILELMYVVGAFQLNLAGNKV